MPVDETQGSDLQARIAALEARLVESEAALARERKLTEEERALRERTLRQLSGLRDSSKAGGADSAAKQVTALERELDKVYGSRTWRAGRVVWSIGTAPRRMVRSMRRRRTPDPTASTTVASPPSTDYLPADYVLIENTVMRRRYQDALSRAAFTNPFSPKNVVMTVFTDDLDAGRGDVYVAVGLGRYLERLGYEVIYLPQERWYDLPEGTAVYVAMLDWVEITRIPDTITRLAWIRNRTEDWARMPWLPLYDLILCSSSATEEAIRQRFPGPTAVMPLAVDAELFRAEGRPEDRAGVVTTQNHWGTERVAHQLLRERSRDFPLGLFGQDRGIAPELADHVRGAVSFFSLPSLYNQAAVVVDDLLAQNSPYGNTNSRVFEALAGGAATLTNQVVGLDALGLGDLPTYQTADELFDLMDAGLTGELNSGVKLLRDAVLDKHTYAIRGAEFDRHLRGLRAGIQPNARHATAVIGFYPDYRNNPYQEMMWSELRNEGAIPIGLGDDFDPEPLVGALAGSKVFHLNWTAPILGPARTEASRLGRYRRFLATLDSLSDAGIPSIWTMHNVMPHECADRGMEKRLRQEIADRVDLIHVMCERTVAEAASLYELPPSKIRVIPHPSYVDVYPNLIDQETARYELGLLPDEMVYLFIGQIRPYKGLDLLLDAFERVHRHRPRSRLIVAGRPGRFPDRPEIEQRARSHPAVLSNFNSIGDDDLQIYLNAADAVVLPYRSGLNSGAMMLAYSFARPVIVAGHGCVLDSFDETSGIMFSWDDGESALYNAMREGERLRSEDHRRAAYRQTDGLHYLETSARFGGLVAEAQAQRGTTTR